MDHRNTFTGKQLKRKLLEKQIFWQKTPGAILVSGIMMPIEQISKAININEHYIKKSILLYEMQGEGD